MQKLLLLLCVFSMTYIPLAGQTTTKLYVAQLAVGKQTGGEWVTLMDMLNLADGPRMGIVEYHKSDGKDALLSITANGTSYKDDHDSSIFQKRDILSSELKSPDGSLFVGWMEFTVPVNSAGKSEIGVSAVYQFRDSNGRVVASVGVPATPAVTGVTLPVMFDNGRVGIAIANPNSGPVDLNFLLNFNEKVTYCCSTVVEQQTVTVPAKSQKAFFLDEVFTWRNPKGRPADCTIWASQPVAFTAVRLDDGPNGSILSGIAVLPESVK